MQLTKSHDPPDERFHLVGCGPENQIKLWFGSKIVVVCVGVDVATIESLRASGKRMDVELFPCKRAKKRGYAQQG